MIFSASEIDDAGWDDIRRIANSSLLPRNAIRHGKEVSKFRRDRLQQQIADGMPERVVDF